MKRDFLLSRAELAYLLGTTGPSVGNAADEGLPVKERGSKGKPAQYDARECIAWWMERERRRAREEGQSRNASTQGDQLDNELKREKLAQLRGETVPRPAFATVLRDILKRLSTAIDRIETRYPERFLNQSDVGVIALLLREIGKELKLALKAPKEWQAVVEREEEREAA